MCWICRADDRGWLFGEFLQPAFAVSFKERLCDRLVIIEELNHALRRVVLEEQLEVPLSFRGSGRAARKEFFFIHD
jgi:hypothetical protein